jgi:hypothetical protein
MLFLTSEPSKLAGFLDALDALDRVDVARDVATDFRSATVANAVSAPWPCRPNSRQLICDDRVVARLSRNSWPEVTVVVM